MIKSIKKRDDESFVIAYELLKDEKDRKLFAEDSINEIENEIKNSIFEQVENTIMAVDNLNPKSYIYGKSYDKPAKPLVEVVLQVLKMLRIEFSVKSIEYCIKCVLSTEQKESRTQLPSKSDSSEMVAELTSNTKEEKEHRFSKK